MKKTFRRTLACILSVLMIVFSVPFTALATPTTVWWTEEDLKLKAEPEYTGYADLFESGEWETESGAATFGEAIWSADGDPVILENFKPALFCTVSDISVAANRTKAYGAAAANTYSAVKNNGLILDPAHLKAGQRIAVAYEVGGIDAWYAGTVAGTFDTTKLKAAYYAKSTWKDSTTDVNSILAKTDALYYTAGLTAMTTYKCSPSGQFANSLLGTADDPNSNFVGNRPYGEYGIVFPVMTFEVLQDCSLDEAITLNGTGTMVVPYKEAVMRDLGKPQDRFSLADYPGYTYSTMPLIYPDAAGAPVECDHATTEVKDAKAATCIAKGYTGDTYCTKCGEKIATGTETAIDPNNHVNTEVINAKEATCAPGYTGDTFCKDCQKTVATGTAIDPVAEHVYTITEETNSDCQTAGKIVRTCSVCGDVQTEYKALGEHSYAEVEGSAVAATCTTAGKTADKVCSVCGDKVAGTETAIDPNNHVGERVVKDAKAADCGHDGYTGDTYCADCNAKLADGTVIPATGEHNYVDVEGSAVAATCTTAGKEADKECSVCGDKITGAATAIDPNNHVGGTVVKNDKAADCGNAGYTGDIYCASCDVKLADGTVIPATGEHNYVEVPGSAVEPSYEAPGKEADKECSVCGDKITGATIPALKGLAVTVVANDRGAATINGQAVTTEDVTVNVAQNSQVTLTATPNEGVQFVGWSVNGKLVSTEANATITALANMTIEPVYQVVGEEFTVIFMDKFGNVISTQVVKSAAEITVPAVPVIDGYTDAAWSLTADQIAALTESTIIKATYGTAAEKTYTVKAAGATITTPYATAQDVNAGIKYNTLVTVTADGAKAWEMNGKTVAYGDTYSFYVGSDVELVPVFEDVVNAAPTVAAVSTTKVGSEGAYKASFLATRSMTADCTYVNAGFVYAVNPASNELTLADVNGSTVLAAYCSTDSDQFALTVGRQSQTGVIVARAFIAYVDAAGATQVAYAEPQTFDYSA